MCDHDDDLSVLLPHHPPEGREGGLGGSLGADVGSGPPEAIDEVGIDVASDLLVIVFAIFAIIDISWH